MTSSRVYIIMTGDYEDTEVEMAFIGADHGDLDYFDLSREYWAAHPELFADLDLTRHNDIQTAYYRLQSMKSKFIDWFKSRYGLTEIPISVSWI